MRTFRSNTSFLRFIRVLSGSTSILLVPELLIVFIRLQWIPSVICHSLPMILWLLMGLITSIVHQVVFWAIIYSLIVVIILWCNSRIITLWLDSSISNLICCRVAGENLRLIILVSSITSLLGSALRLLVTLDLTTTIYCWRSFWSDVVYKRVLLMW